MPQKISWDELKEEQVNPSMKRKMIFGDQVMIAKMKFTDGFLVPLHNHENEQITQVLSGTIRFWFGNNKEETIDVHAGEALIIPSDLPHEALMIGQVEEIDTFSPPRKDWLNGSDDYLRE